jgi:pantetheine-phosphate adenylyltransferase
VKRALCPGTFDPMTNGHLDVIERAAGVFDELIVVVALSPDKGGGPLFTLDERVEMVTIATAHLANVTVRPFDSLLVDLARQLDATIIVKGLRAVTDFEREFQMAQLNYRIANEIETMFIVSIPDYMYLSSSAVKEIAGYGGSVEGLVPAHVNERLVERLRKGR